MTACASSESWAQGEREERPAVFWGGADRDLPSSTPFGYYVSVVALFLCSDCGAGFPKRTLMRRHLEAQGADRATAYALAARVARTEPPPAWRCIGCRRRFDSLRGLLHHVGVTRHGHSPAPC